MNYEKIQQQFEEVIRYSQDKDLVKPLPNLELSDLFTKWYKNFQITVEISKFLCYIEFYIYDIQISVGGI